MSPSVHASHAPDRTADLVRQGSVRHIARLIRSLDDGCPAAAATLDRLFPHTGGAWTVGITGVPGAGKSTLCDALIAGWRSRGLRVGILAVDPTSPFTGGAILGDRVRMQRHATDDGVFLYSLATRGHLGGLSRATASAAHVLDAAGFDRILIETVGVGQDEVDIVRTADTTVVVLVPGLGDEVQAIKAGVMEIADIFCINKADRPDADSLLRQLRQLAALGADGARSPDIVRTIATVHDGIDQLLDTIEARVGSGEATPALQRRREQRLRSEVVLEVAAQLRDAALSLTDGAALESVLRRQRSPRSEATGIVKRLLGTS